MVLFQYHSMIVFCLLTIHMIIFVVSLQKGFYGYQFRQLGWTLLSAVAIITGVTGLIVALWKCRLWLIFAVLTITAHNAFDYLVNKYSPVRTPMLNLKPDATMEGFAVGVLVSFIFFTVTSMYLLDRDWFRTVPTKLSLIPFDSEAYRVDRDGDLFK